MVSPGIVLLAAGASTRMGQPKQLLQFQGETLLRRAARTAIESHLGPAIVVLGHRAEELQSELGGLQVSPVTNADWPRGIGSSIRCGVQKLLMVQPEAKQTIILLCDHPLIRPPHLHALVDAHWQSKMPVCVSSFGDALGPPILIATPMFEGLLELADERGAKSLWIERPGLVFKVPCPEAGVDIDTPEDFGRLLGGA